MATLGAFVNLRKATLSLSCLGGKFVRLSVRMEQLGSQGTDFNENWNLSIFRETVEKIQISLKSRKFKFY